MMQRKVPLLKGSPQQIAAALQEEIRRLEDARPTARDEAPLSAGCWEIDRLLPERGLRRGWLVEWLGVEGGGAGTLALIAAREACLDGGAVVVMDRWRRFYPPAAAALGIDLETIIVVRPQHAQDELWALEQALRCRGVAAVWAPLETVDDRAFRRLQLAAEEGETLGLLVRSAHLRGQPTWSDVQFWVEPKVGSVCRTGSSSRESTSRETEAPAESVPRPDLAAIAPGAALRRFRIELTRCRGGPAQGAAEVEFDEVTGALRGASPHEETHPLPVASPLADPAAHRRPTTA